MVKNKIVFREIEIMKKKREKKGKEEEAKNLQAINAVFIPSC